MAKLIPLLVAVLLVALAGCSQPRADRFEILHVHGLSYDANATTLYVATHHGLARGQGNGKTWEYVGDMFDYMGFTRDSTANTTFYSSGHPGDPRAFGGVHLGLRRSTDGGVTWEQRSLKGQVDFHSLAAAPGMAGGLVGIWRDTLMQSNDGGLTWTNTTGPASVMFDLALTAQRAYVATPDGLLAGHIGDPSSWQRLAGPDPDAVAQAIAASPEGTILFVGTGDGTGGTTYRSGDGGLTWTKATQRVLADADVPIVFAFDSVDPMHVYAASAGGDLLESRDAGVTWDVLRKASA